MSIDMPWQKEGMYYQQHQLHQVFLYPHTLPGHYKRSQFAAFTHYEKIGKKVRFFLGCMHLYFVGSVVNVMAAGKRNYPLIVQSLETDEEGGLTEAWAHCYLLIFIV